MHAGLGALHGHGRVPCRGVPPFPEEPVLSLLGVVVPCRPEVGVPFHALCGLQAACHSILLPSRTKKVSWTHSGTMTSKLGFTASGRESSRCICNFTGVLIGQHGVCRNDNRAMISERL